MRKNMPQVSAARGFTLVELMIALLIGLIISAGVIQIFSASRTTYQLDESLARAQENGRFALEFLAQDIRHAGYAGCQRDTNIKLANTLATSTMLGITGISGAEFTTIPTGVGDTYNLIAAPANTSSGWSPALTGILGIPGGVPAVAALPGSDVLVLQRMVPNSWALASPYVTADNVYIDPAFANKIKLDDVMLVADCKNAVLFKVTAITPTGEISHASGSKNRCARWTGGLDPLNPAASACAKVFDSDNIASTTAFGKLETIEFFVANDNASGENRPTLFRRVVSPTGETETTPLVEGVENFQVLYGVDDVIPPDGAADHYVTANNVVDFAKVVSVQIGILVYGVNVTGRANDTAFDTNIHDVAGTNIVPEVNSQRTRRVFNTTIQLRNRSY